MAPQFYFKSSNFVLVIIFSILSSTMADVACEFNGNVFECYDESARFSLILGLAIGLPILVLTVICLISCCCCAACPLYNKLNRKKIFVSQQEAAVIPPMAARQDPYIQQGQGYANYPASNQAPSPIYYVNPMLAQEYSSPPAYVPTAGHRTTGWVNEP